MKLYPTHLVLISKPGLMRNSLLAYFRSLVSMNLEITTIDPAEFIEQDYSYTAEALVLNEENDPHEIDQILRMVDQTQSRLLVIVDDVYRQRELLQVTTAPVVVWGFIRQNLEQFLSEL